MYVQHQVPHHGRGISIVLVHGSVHTGKTYEETPDGRMGWADYFVRRGFTVYVVDHAGRARSGFDPSPTNRAKARDSSSLIPTFRKVTNEQAWVNFRIGAKAFVPFENTQSPVVAAEQYFAQMVPNTESSYSDDGQSTIAALSKLLDRIGPAILLVHSQSALYGISATAARPSQVKALVAIEPVSCAVSEDMAKAVFRQVPFVTVWGDFRNGSPAWEP